jgi:signal transduction histidine kinase
MRLLFLYLKNKKSNIIQVVLVYVVLLLVIWLYNLPYYGAFLFGIELYGALYIVYLIYDYSVFADKIRTLERNIKTDDIQNIALPDKKNDVEALYADIIIKLHEQKRKQYDAGVEASRNLKDYYACWAHQIKTPIAAAKLIIQSLDDVVRNLENTSWGNSCNECYDKRYDDLKNNQSNEKNDDNDLEKLNRKLNELSHEMFRIEFYTDAVMDYLRLEDISSDYEFKLCRLDVAVKKVVKKFAPQFIGRHISLHIEQIEDSVCTDSKWLGFIIEQLISNAVKYSKDGGSVRIYTLHGNGDIKKNSKDDSLQLVIEDTGIGISEEDIPRIMERGFTGYNGRLDKKSSGIGLYLCRKAADRLGFVITFDASYKNGTRVVIDMTQRYTKHE